MSRSTEPPAQRVGEVAPGATFTTSRFRRNDNSNNGNNGSNGATTVFERPRALGAVGDYDLVQQLGGSLFVGHHRVTKQPFAIRLLEPAGRTDQLARQLAAIDHPNVVRTIEVGLHEGRVYLVMEHLRGTTLASWLDVHGVPPSAQVIRIGMHVARGLEAVHSRGIVHRNLDASAVIIVPSERGRSTIKLADFELAPSDEVVRIARHSMSPELVRGGAIDHRTDLYSLGVLLHRACTLKDPFEGSPIDILAMYRFRSVMRPEPALAGVPPELAATIRRCLAEEAADRYRTAGEVVEALRRVTDGPGRRERSDTPARSDLLLDGDQIPTAQRGSAGSAPVAAPPAPAPAPSAPSAYAAISAAASARTVYAPVPAAASAAPAAPAVHAPMVASPGALTLLAAPGALAAPAPAPVQRAPMVAAPAAPTLLAVPRAAAAALPAAHARAFLLPRAPEAPGPAVHARAIVLPRAPVSLAPAAPAPMLAPQRAPAAPAPVQPAPVLAPARASDVPTPAWLAPARAPDVPTPAWLAPARASDVPTPAWLAPARPAPAGAAPARPAPAADPSAVPERIQGRADSSGILIAPSGSGRVATALPLDPAAAGASRPRRRVPWKPAAVLAVAIVVGFVLSLWTMGGSDDADAPAATASAPAASAPAASAPAASAPAAPVARSAAPQPMPGCTTAVVPDVVLTADPATIAPAGAQARAAEVPQEPSLKPVRRKAKPRKAKPPESTPTEDERALEQPRSRADEEPISGETLVVPDE